MKGRDCCSAVEMSMDRSNSESLAHPIQKLKKKIFSIKIFEYDKLMIGF